MKARVKQVEGLSLVGKADSNHWLPLDSVKTFGGAEAATKPMELVLIALGGCTSMDVLSILKKMREDVRDYDVNWMLIKLKGIHQYLRKYICIILLKAKISNLRMSTKPSNYR